jgi:hypothetical protein
MLDIIPRTNYTMNLDKFNDKTGIILFCIYHLEPVFISKLDRNKNITCPICGLHTF